MIGPVDNTHETEVATLLGVDLNLDGDLPLLTWSDGFQAEFGVFREGKDLFEITFIPLSRSSPSSRETENLKFAEFLRAVQVYAASVGRGIYLDGMIRGEVGHILDHLGFELVQSELEELQEETFGQEFVDGEYEWRPT